MKELKRPIRPNSFQQDLLMRSLDFAYVSLLLALNHVALVILGLDIIIVFFSLDRSQCFLNYGFVIFVDFN